MGRAKRGCYSLIYQDVCCARPGAHPRSSQLTQTVTDPPSRPVLNIAPTEPMTFARANCGLEIRGVEQKRKRRPCRYVEDIARQLYAASRTNGRMASQCPFPELPKFNPVSVADVGTRRTLSCRSLGFRLWRAKATHNAEGPQQG